MSDINLLPENLRQEEEKERAAPKDSAAMPSYHLLNQLKEERSPFISSAPEKVSYHEGQEKLEEAVKTLPKIKATEEKRKEKKSFWHKLFKKKRIITQQIEVAPSNLSRQTIKDIKERVISKTKESGLSQPLKPESLPVEPRSTIFGKEIDVNLLPEGINLIPLKKLKFYFTLTAVICLVLVGLGYLGITLYNQVLEKQIKGVDQQLETAEISYEKLKAKEGEALAWGKKVTAISAIFNNHIYWSKFFQHLEKTTIPDVYYTSIGISSDGLVTLTGQAINYTAVARQYQVFLNNPEIFPKVTFGSFSGGGKAGEGVGFNVQLQLATSIYHTLENQSN